MSAERASNGREEQATAGRYIPRKAVCQRALPDPTHRDVSAYAFGFFAESDVTVKAFYLDGCNGARRLRMKCRDPARLNGMLSDGPILLFCCDNCAMMLVDDADPYLIPFSNA